MALSLSPAPAASQDWTKLAAEVSAIADNPNMPFPAEAAALGFRDSYDFADAMNPSTIRRLLLMHRSGAIILPSQILDAFRFKSPGIINKRRGRD